MRVYPHPSLVNHQHSPSNGRNDDRGRLENPGVQAGSLGPADLPKNLVAAGLPRGGALACAHVGVELVLDGELLRDPSIAAAVIEVYGAMRQPPAAAIVVGTVIGVA